MTTQHYDLHTHSSCSDGTLAPEQLVARAAAAGVRVLALTDHDTTAGLGAAATAAREAGIELVTGVEVSVSWEQTTLHVVGLRVDPSHPGLERGLVGLREFRDWRGEEIARRLERRGIGGALEGAAEFATGPILSRTHFARYLVAQGHVKTMQKAFDRYLGQGRAAHVSGRWAELPEALGWIRDAGGIAVLAHPGRYKVGRARMNRLLEAFRASGGAGIEVISGSQPLDSVDRFAAEAQRHGLLASVGSDYHGPEQTWLELGRLPSLPANCKPVWEHW